MKKLANGNWQCPKCKGEFLPGDRAISICHTGKLAGYPKGYCRACGNKAKKGYRRKALEKKDPPISKALTTARQALEARRDERAIDA